MKLWLVLNLLWATTIGGDNFQRLSTIKTIEPTAENLEKQVVSNRRACQVLAYSVNRNPEGLNIRKSPSSNADIVRNVSTLEAMITFHINGSQGNWVQISQVEGDEGLIFQGQGWMYSSVLATSTRGYSKGGVSVLANPNNRSKAVGRIKPQTTVQILSCDGRWAFVKHEKIQGWLAPADQCPNRLSPCP